jgi:AAA domain-containing protein/DnaB helicase-like protein
VTANEKRNPAVRALPANLDAERCVLASLICKAKDCTAAFGLSVGDFSSHSHRLIYKAIQKLTSAAKSTDIIAIMDELGEDFDAVGGGAYLGELMQGMYAGPNIANCVRIIREKSMLHELANLGELAWNANGDGGQVLERVKMLSARIEQGLGQKAKSLPFTSANEGAKTTESVDWLVKGYVAQGGLTLLSAKVKMGKTTLATRLVEAMLVDRPFIGAQTKYTPVVYLTEQPRVSFNVALQRANLTEKADLRLLHFTDILDTPWASVAAAAGEECKRFGSNFLIVDTLAQFAGLVGDEENNSGAQLEAVRPLQAIAGQGVGVLILSHDRKSGGEVGDATRGSSALPGAVDIVLSLRRPDGNSRKSLRVVQSLSRFSETPAELVIELTDHGYIALGEKADVALQEAREAILATAPISEADAITLEEISEAAKTVRSTAQRALKELGSCGKIQKVGTGKKGNAFRYFRPEKGSAQTSSLYGQKVTNSPAVAAFERSPAEPREG